MTTYVDGGDGRPVCEPCAMWQCDSGYECRIHGCECDCNRRRAAEVDDRPPEVLDSVARDLAAERYQGAVFSSDEYRRLLVERFGRPPRSAA